MALSVASMGAELLIFFVMFETLAAGLACIREHAQIVTSSDVS
jgi:hypothetical protein